MAHLIKHVACVVNAAEFGVAGDHGAPRDEISVRHSVEHETSIVNAVACEVHMDERGVHEGVGGVAGGDGQGVELAAEREGREGGGGLDGCGEDEGVRREAGGEHAAEE